MKNIISIYKNENAPKDHIWKKKNNVYTMKLATSYLEIVIWKKQLAYPELLFFFFNQRTMMRMWYPISLSRYRSYLGS